MAKTKNTTTKSKTKKSTAEKSKQKNVSRKTKATKKAQKNPTVTFFRSIVLFFRDEKVKFVISLFVLMFALLLTLAFVSYLFTWKVDQSKLDYGMYEFFSNPEIRVDNWAGKMGAALSNTFIHNWFGLPSFGFIFLLTLISFKLIKIDLLPFRQTLINTLLIMIWLSVALAFFFGQSYFFLGGAHGYYIANWFSAFAGRTGTAFVLLITLVAFFMFSAKNSINWLKNNLLNPFSLQPATATENTQPTMQNNTAPQTKAPQPATLEEQYRSGAEVDLSEVDGDVEKKEYLLRKKQKDADIGFEIEKPNSENDEEKETPLSEKTKDNTANNGTPNELLVKYLGDEFETRHPEEKNNVKEAAEKAEELTDKELALQVEKNKDIQYEQQKLNLQEEYDPKLDLSDYKMPTTELLENHQVPDSEVTNEELMSNKQKIEDTLNNFKIEITKIKATIGPTVTLYEIVPAPGIRISKIKNLEDDIALNLAALGIRIIAPMPGRGTIGIEVPNQKPEIVSMRSVIQSKRFQSNKYELPIALGKTISNETYVFDLTKMPHLLVAGATGQGKSVGLNAIIASLLYSKHPAQVKFVLVDPKKVELTLYEHIERHFLAKLPDEEEAIITDNQKVIHTLSSLNVEMDNRYALLKKAQVRNIKEYNAKFISRKLNPDKGHKYLPYLVLVVDEFADLIMTAGKEIEQPIARIAQLARAIGIHLIVATQRPSTNIITGVIKANFPSRIAFKVASMIDSRTILDSPGANQLIGRGDMLITQGSDLIRLQCAFIDTPELEKITEYIGSQRGYPTAFLLPEYDDGEGSSEATEVDLSKRDEYFADAARIVVLNQSGSASLIQRKLSIGYNRAGRIIDQLEAAGIVGPFEGSKARQVLYPDEYSLEQFLNTI